MVGVAFPGQLLLPTRRQLLQSILPHRLQHHEARLTPPTLCLAHQAVLAQPLYAAKYIELAIRVGDRFRRLQGAAPDEDGQAAEQPLLVGIKEVVAPRDRIAERAVPGWGITGAAGQQRQSLLQPRQQRLWGEQPHPGRRQLDGQRQPIQAPADLGDRRVHSRRRGRSRV